MEKENEKIELYVDRPETKENLKFAHKILIKWFESLVRDVNSPFRIAITGDLGTGKSTMIYNALEELEKTDNYKIAYVDVWKLDKLSARRSTILRVAKQFGINLEKYEKLKQSIYGSVSEASDIQSTEGLGKSKNILCQGLFWLMFFLSVALGFIAYLVISKIDPTNDTVPGWLKIISGVGVATYSLITNIISRKMLQVKATVGKDPFVGPEEFEEAFQKILDETNKRCVVVFDNIDRAPKSKTEEILTGISTFFDHSAHSKMRDLIIVVPFSKNSSIDLDESTVQKFFDAIIPLPNLMPEDLFDYTEDKFINIGWKSEASEIAQLVDQSNLKTPRSILHFTNELNAQLNLVKSLETNKFVNEDGDYGTYLQEGSVSSHKVFFAKLKLCERIYPNFLENGLSNVVSPEEIMNYKRYEANSEDKLSDKERARLKELHDFLRATEGLPEKLPESESLEKFAYFKGSDLELSIPGGTKLTKALINRSVEEVDGYISKIDEDSILKIFKYAISKNKRNPQRVKNAIHSLVDIYKEEIPFKLLRKAIATAIVDNKGILDELSIGDIERVAPIIEEKLESTHLWKLIDEEYRTNVTAEEYDPSEDNDYRHSYLQSVLKQPKGQIRAMLNSDHIFAEDICNDSIFIELDRVGLKFFVGQGNINSLFEELRAQKYLFSKEKAVNLGKAIGVGVSNIGTEDAKFLATFLSEMWNEIAAKIGNYKELSGLLVSQFYLIKNLKIDERNPATNFNPFLGFHSRHAHIGALMTNEYKIEAFSFLILVGQKVNISGHVHIVNALKNFLNNSTKEDFEDVFNFFGEWSWISDLKKIAPAELKTSVENTGTLNYLVTEGKYNAADYLVEEMDVLIQNDSFKEIFKIVSDDSEKLINKIDVCDHLYDNDELDESIDIYLATFEYLDHNVELIEKYDLKNKLSSLLSKCENTEQIDSILEWLLKVDRAVVRDKINDFKSEISSEENLNWNIENVFLFYICIKGATNRGQDFYVTLFDKAIERLVMSGTDPDLLDLVVNTIVESWKNGKGVEKDLLINLRDAVSTNSNIVEEYKNSFEENLVGIAKKNKLIKELGISEGMFEKVKSIFSDDD